MSAENGIYATADNFGDVASDMYEKRPWVESVAVPESIKRKYPSKHYVYKVVVKWSNGSETIIYRRYSLFFDFVVKLQELLSKVSKINQKLDDANLQLPELPSKSLFARSQTHQVAERRRRKVEEFCQQLIMLPPEISESGLVLGFFNIWPDDTLLRDHSPGPEHVISSPVLVPNSNGTPLPLLKNADPERSLPTANGRTQEPLKKRPLSQTLSENVVESVISHPDEMEHLDQYRVLGNYERKDNHQVDLIQGQLVHVIEKHDTGWWMVMSDNEQGYAPAAYLEPLDQSVADNDVQTSADEVYEAMESYIPVSLDEIGFQAQDRITVVSKSMDGWWKIRCNGKTGFAPAALIRRVVADKHRDNGFQSERAIYEELNIHHPPPRRNTLDQSVIRRIPPGYVSPRENPDLAKVMEENIYCDPADDSPEEDNIYKVPRPLMSPANSSQPAKRVLTRRASGGSSGEESSHAGHRRLARMGSHGSTGPRRGSGHSHGSRSTSNSASPPPVEEVQQIAPVLKKPPVRPKPPTKPKPKDSKPKTDPKPETANCDTEILENDLYVEMEGSDPIRKGSCKRTQSLTPFVPMEPVESPVRYNNMRSASVPTVNFNLKHSADDYEDLDTLEEKSETPPLPALDDYVDMSGSSPLENLKKSEEFAKTNSSGMVAPAPPPRVKPGAPSKTKVSPVSKTFSIDPDLPDVFEEECYIEMDAEKSEQRASSVSSPPPRITPIKPRSISKPPPPPPYSQSPLAKRGLVRAKSLEDLLSSSKDDTDGPVTNGSPPLPKRNFAPPLPARNPPTERPNPEKSIERDPGFMPLKPKAGKTRNPFKRNRNQTEPSEAPPLPRTKPNREPDRSISPIARHCISPPGFRDGPHPLLAHRNSEPSLADTEQVKKTHVAAFSFVADSERCLSFSIGDKCELVRRNEETGWWLVKLAGKIGWTPGDFWRELRERSVTNVATPNAPPPIVRKPRSHTVAEINTGQELVSSIESSLQDSLVMSGGKGSLSSSVEGDLNDSGRYQAAKSRAPPKPFPEAGPSAAPRKAKPPPPVKYSSSPSISSSQTKSPPPLPPANATRRLGSQSSAPDVNGSPVSPNQTIDDYVMLNQVSTSSIESAQWFAGKMERVQADSFLMEHARQREFLVRERTTRDGYYALSVRYHYNIRHFNIDPTPDGQFCMGTLVFPSIEEVIKHYKSNSLFIHDNQHVTLSQAVKKRTRDTQRSQN